MVVRVQVQVQLRRNGERLPQRHGGRRRGAVDAIVHVAMAATMQWAGSTASKGCGGWAAY